MAIYVITIIIISMETKVKCYMYPRSTGVGAYLRASSTSRALMSISAASARVSGVWKASPSVRTPQAERLAQASAAQALAASLIAVEAAAEVVSSALSSMTAASCVVMASSGANTAPPGTE